MECIICNQDYPEEDLLRHNDKDACSSCITELLRQDLTGGRDTDKLKELIKEYEEFNLSEKRKQACSDCGENTEGFFEYSEENVKEFIQKLKQNINERRMEYANPSFRRGLRWVEYEINKLAGDKLF